MNLSFSGFSVKAIAALSAGFVFMLGLVVAGAASAEPRVALVIGNSAYQGDLPALPNPANDAKLMARTLKSVGFDVVEAEDATQDDIKKAIASFSEKLTAAGTEGTGLFFYAGHGVQVGGENYLIPVDAKIKREADVDLVAVSASTVLKQMEFANTAVNIIILDACRNNPLGDGARSMSRGLAKIETAPRGSFIAYSTAPGSTAADGDGANSPYTTALAETITEPGLSIADVFQEVRTKVLASTKNAQTPWDSSSLTGRFYFKPPEAGPVAGVVAPSTSAEEEKLKNEKTYWDSVKDSNDPEQIQMYVGKYPNGYFVDLANAKLDELKGGAQVASADAVQAPKPEAAAQVAAKPSAGASFIAQSQTVYAKSGGQVRAAPDAGAALVSKLQANTEVTATGLSTDGKWWRVALADGQTGYMHKSVVSEQPLQAASAAPQLQAAVQSVPPTNGAGVEMISANAAPAQGAVGVPTGAPAGNDIDMQTLGQAASAIQSGNLSQAGSALNALFGSGRASNQQAALPQVQFQELNITVTVKKGTLIRSSPMFNAAAVATATQDTKLQARGKTANNLWWQVVLLDGTFGYVEGRQIAQ